MLMNFSIKHASHPLLFFTNKWKTVLINHDRKTSYGLIQDGLFTNWKFGFDYDPRLLDLKLPVLELFHIVFEFFMEKKWENEKMGLK